MHTTWYTFAFYLKSSHEEKLYGFISKKKVSNDGYGMITVQNVSLPGLLQVATFFLTKKVKVRARS